MDFNCKVFDLFCLNQSVFFFIILYFFQAIVLDLVAEAMVKEVYGGKAKGFLLDAFPMNLEQVRPIAD